ncbi:MAG: hypothetical protein R3E48_06015 [Burkholderiaceae bacterium]
MGQAYRLVSMVAGFDPGRVASELDAMKGRITALEKLAGKVGALPYGEIAADEPKLIARIGAMSKRMLEAVDLSSIDPNTGIAAMQSATIEQTELDRLLSAMLKRTDVMAAWVTWTRVTP